MTLADRLREALATGMAASLDLLPGDAPGQSDAPGDDGKPAAVLVAVTDRPRPGVLLTVRPATMRSHPGQIAFPGGRIDPGDDGPVGAALREAEEEIGLPRGVPQVLGIADPYNTVTGYRVTPVLAVVPPDLDLVPNPAEVADWFEAPLDHILDATQQHRRTAVHRGRTRHYYEIVWGDYHIWGATAAMIVNLARRLGQ